MQKKLAFLLVLLSVFLFSACGLQKNSSATGLALYQTADGAVPYPLTDGNTVSVLIDTTVEFSGFEAVITTDGSENLRAALSIYVFDTDYRKTVESTPAVKESFDNIKDGDKLYLQTKPMAAGKYLLLVSSDTPGTSVQRHDFVPALEQKASFFYSGVQVQTGAFPVRLLFQEKALGGKTLSDVLLSQTEPTTQQAS